MSWTERRKDKLPNLPGEFPFMCGNCGQRFASKAAKRRHKGECAPDALENETSDDDICPPEYLYGRSHSTPEVRARADAEWQAMDWRGRLPAGWTYKPGLQADWEGR